MIEGSASGSDPEATHRERTEIDADTMGRYAAATADELYSYVRLYLSCVM